MTAPPPRRIEALDLLRGTAVALVMLRHAFPGVFAGAGVVGVVMFFSISGYLITGLLQRELRQHGRLDLRTFYLRRAYRLVPALLVLVAGVVLVTLVFDPLGDREQLPRTVTVALTWTANLPFHQGSDATFHLWTLATEEQFYLVWPALLGAAWALGRPRLALLVAAVGSALACVATVAWLWDTPDLAYALPTSWAVCFVVGAAAHGLSWRPGRPAVVAALALLALLAVLPLRGHALLYLAGGPAIAGLTAVLLLAWRDWASVRPRRRLLAVPLRGLVALGTLSYAAYLWNYPLTLWLRPSLDGAAGPVAMALTLLAAALSWRLVEEPVMRRAPRRAPPARTETAPAVQAPHAGIPAARVPAARVPGARTPSAADRTPATDTVPAADTATGVRS